MHHCLISGIIQHHTQGYGFKLTFLDVKDAQTMKNLIKILLEELEYIITTRRGYHDL